TLVLLVSFVAAHRLRVALDEPLGRAAASLAHYAWLLALILPVWLGLLAVLGGYGLGWAPRARPRLLPPAGPPPPAPPPPPPSSPSSGAASAGAWGGVSQRSARWGCGSSGPPCRSGSCGWAAPIGGPGWP